MFGFLKKKGSTTPNELLYAAASGSLVPISEVKDPVFSQKMMGDGFAVIPDSGEIYSPIQGEVMSVFQTKHAIGMKMTNGLEILLHMGVDTVELKGEPFDVKVSDGAKVTNKTLVAVVDLEAIKAADKANDIIVVITNMDAVKHFELTKTGKVAAGEEVGKAQA
ncbi:PTS glucose transporter subunit IIA [Erwinia sp. CPCC 100877]|nr:PTS glucose transporter subunit IIA [Erwinia sp. CPCC 100877]